MAINSNQMQVAAAIALEPARITGFMIDQAEKGFIAASRDLLPAVEVAGAGHVSSPFPMGSASRR
jgi:hypothetical protein